MPKPKRVEFGASKTEFLNAVQQLLINRDEFKDTDTAYLKISAGSLEMSTVGTEAAVDGLGAGKGVVRLPVTVLEKLAALAKTYKSNSISFVFEAGVAKVGSSRVSHADIVLSAKIPMPASIPVSASTLDLLAIQAVIPQQGVVSEKGIKERIAQAMKKRDSSIEIAFETLKEFGVEKAELLEIINSHIKAMAKGVKKSLTPK
jgi:hypothetical protein